MLKTKLRNPKQGKRVVKSKTGLLLILRWVEEFPHIQTQPIHGALLRLSQKSFWVYPQQRIYCKTKWNCAFNAFGRLCQLVDWRSWKKQLTSANVMCARKLTAPPSQEGLQWSSLQKIKKILHKNAGKGGERTNYRCGTMESAEKLLLG